MKPKVIMYKKVDESVLSYLRETCEVSYFEELNSKSFPDFFKEVGGAQGLLGSGLKVEYADFIS